MTDADDLNGLGPYAFEHLVNAIVLKVLGSGATGFGPGPDAGRDGWFEGEAPYPSSNNHWTGIWYIQCKFHAPHLSKDPQKWLLGQIREELKAYNNPGSRREWPDNWIVATNIDPSADGGRGTFDQARKLVQKANPAIAQHFHIWGGEKIRSFLSDFPSVASRFGHFLTPGHVISALLEQIADERATLHDIVKYTVIRGIEDQRHTRLEQAGSSEDRRPGIDALFVDLPFIEERSGIRGKAVATVASASAQNHIVNPDDPLGESWAQWRACPSRASVWFVRAGPGRGKSSICQFFCQVQRAAIVLQASETPVHPDTRALAQRIKERAVELNAWPVVPRVPIWVELKSYAAWISEQRKDAPRGVASFVCSVLSREVEASVPVKTLRRALGDRSWVVVFDGLDEVPSDVKDLVANEVVAFIRDMSVTSDLFSICTSRPQGYSGQFDALRGAVVDLSDLPPDLALECATRVAVIDRSVPDANKAKETLRRSIESPAVRELLTTPLQAHIIAVLVRNGQQPPERKWELYRKFYEVIRTREANTDLPDPRLRDLFQRDTALIDSVHQQLGFALHSRAERASGAEASLTKSEFRRIVENVVRETRARDDVQPVVETLMRATTERLVLINTPDQGDRVRFDLRAIQEFFAAEFLYTDTPAEVVRERLELIAGDPHWREVMQFVLGALISLRRATEWAVALEVLRSVDDDGGSDDDGDGNGDESERSLSRCLARGALHCALLFENGAVENSRKTRDQLRSLLSPLSPHTDTDLLRVLLRVPPSESRTWLRKWAIDQVRSLQATESRGAMWVAAELCAEGSEAPEFLTLLDAVPSSEVDAVLLARWVEERLRGDRMNPRQQEVNFWALDRLLRRNDCVSAAPRAVAHALWSCWSTTGDSVSRSRMGSSDAVRRAPSDSVEDKLKRLFDVVHVVAGGRAEADIFIAKVRPEAEKVMRDIDMNEGGLLNWLSCLWRASHGRKVEDARAALQMMGDSWDLVESLPVDLRDGLPIPIDRRVKPCDIAALIAHRADNEYSNLVSTGSIDNIALERGPGSRACVASFRLFSPDELYKIAPVAAQYPHIAWRIWCHTLSQPNLWLLDEETDQHNRSSPSLSMQKTMYNLLKQNPFLVLSLQSIPTMAGLVGLGRHCRRMFHFLKSKGISFPLQVTGTSRQFRSVLLKLPDDEHLLPLVASSHVSATAIALRGHGTVRNFDEVRASIGATIADIGGLRRVADDVDACVDLRASATFLAAMHPDGGIDDIVQRKSALVQFASTGAPVCGCVALAVEVLDGYRRRDVRLLLSKLIDMRRTGRDNSDALRGEIWCVNTVLKIWRERSTAPVTADGAAERWLGW